MCKRSAESLSQGTATVKSVNPTSVWLDNSVSTVKTANEHRADVQAIGGDVRYSLSTLFSIHPTLHKPKAVSLHLPFHVSVEHVSSCSLVQLSTVHYSTLHLRLVLSPPSLSSLHASPWLEKESPVIR